MERANVPPARVYGEGQYRMVSWDMQSSLSYPTLGEIVASANEHFPGIPLEELVVLEEAGSYLRLMRNPDPKWPLDPDPL